MGIIFLTSAGFSNQKIKEEFLKTVGEASNKAAVIITTAREEKEKEQNEYCQLVKRQLEEVGFKRVDFADLEIEPDKDFSFYNVIYVVGGNTFKLLKFAKDADFKQTIENLLARGGVYVGVSAGSGIMCPNIDITEWKIKAGLRADKNRFGLTYLTAFHFVPFLLVVHFVSELTDMVKKYIQEETVYPVRVLTDSQALMIKDGQTILIGDGKEIKI